MTQIHDFAEHTSILLLVISTLASIVGFLFWRMISRIEKKIDGIEAMHHACKEELPNLYAGKEDFEYHYHEGRPAPVVINGRVFRRAG
jgi:hypothetical protein